MEDQVTLWLHNCGLGEYAETFKEAGYDDINLIKLLNESDLDAMGIDKPGTRKKILVYADALKLYQDVHMIPLEAISPLHPPQPTRPKGNNRANPYRCTKCCEFKIRSLDGKAHVCNPDLIGHSWENCPTKNLRQHPEEKQRRKGGGGDRSSKPSRPRKRKGIQEEDEDEAQHVAWAEAYHDEHQAYAQHHHHHHHQYQVYADADQHLVNLQFAFQHSEEDDPSAKRRKLDGDLQGHVIEMGMLPELEDQLDGGSSELHHQEDEDEQIPSHLHHY